MPREHDPKKPRENRVKKSVTDATADAPNREWEMFSTDSIQDLDSGTRESQADVLSDRRLPAIQRQAMASRLGQAKGNRYLNQILAQLHPYGQSDTVQRQGPEAEQSSDSSETQTNEEQAAHGMSTEFGTFMIYPDSFVGPLPMAERGAEAWPIHQSDFDSLTKRLTQIKEGTSTLVIDGDSEFQVATLLDLAWLMTSSAGQELLSDLQDAIHVCTIKKIAGGNSVTGFGDGAWETETSPPLPGGGSSCTLNYNPTRLWVGDGTEAWHHRPPAIGLAHELVHVWAVFQGALPRGRTEGTRNAELMAVGLGDYKKIKLTENRFRQAFGLPLRPVY